MEQDKIDSAEKRAQEVVNGFKRATEQNARDAVNLAKHIKELAHMIRIKDRQIDEMKKRMLADSLLNAAKKGKQENPMSDFFKGLGL